MDRLEDICFICEDDLNDPKLNKIKVEKGIITLVEASKQRGDSKHLLLKGKCFVWAHDQCRKRYTRKQTIASDKKKASLEKKKLPDSPSKVILRSALPTFVYKRDCLFCGKEACKKKEMKKEKKYRQVVYDVHTLEAKFTILNRAAERHDKFGRIVKARLENVSDLVSGDAKYHFKCYRDFFNAPKKPTANKGRPLDKTKSEAFEKLLRFMEENDECQFRLDDLLTKMSSFTDSTSTTPCTYTKQYLKEKLKDHFGNAVVITDIAGKSSLVNFKGKADEILHDKWYSDRETNAAEERLRIVTTAAKIIREDIRELVHDCSTYPPADIESLTDMTHVPETLKAFYGIIISSSNPDSELVNRKRIAQIHALIAACRPRSFISSVLLSLGVYVHRHFASRLLVDILSSLGFSASMAEVKRYECSVIFQEKDDKEVINGKPQFVYDNADFNIRSLDGHNTFHVMGGIKCTAPVEKITAEPVPRLAHLPTADEIAEKGKIEIQWYKNPQESGLKNIPIRELKAEAEKSVKTASLVDTLWISAKWAGVKFPPSWNGYMKASFSKSSGTFHRTKVEVLPFINLQPGNLSTIFTALVHARNYCSKNTSQKIVFVTQDQPLYNKSIKVVKSDTTGKLDGVVMRLGGFHLLMSFLGAIGYVMNGSGIEELWSEVYAKASVHHMVSGHAYSRALRAHFLTQQALATIVLRNIKNDSLKREIESMFEKFKDNEMTVTEVTSNPSLIAMWRSLKDLLLSESQKSRTAKLWVQYFEMVSLVRMFIRAERIGDFDLHLHCVREMIALFHAAGHLHYAKSAHFYCQEMENLAKVMPADEFSKFASVGYFTIRRSHEFWSGTWTDMTIEQFLMRSMKVNVGFVHGRGTTDSVLSQWILAGPGTLELCDSLETL